MPAYDYQCNTCEAVQEEVHSFKKNPRIKCNKCGGKCHRIITNAKPLVFKGEGWTPKFHR